ncbi:MAG: MerR family transcriptional regulator [Pseudomonadota bacterium]
MPKDADAFRTIGELSDQLGVAQHILRYWETRFPQLQPLKRAGNRRYYRPEDVALVERINRLLNDDGYTIRGVQKVLAGKTEEQPAPQSRETTPQLALEPELLAKLKQLRAKLADALNA